MQSQNNPPPNIQTVSVMEMFDEIMNNCIECQEFSYKSAIFEDSLDNNFKKKHGIFYTDIELAKKIILKLNLPLSSNLFDPCCGIGSFLFAAKKLGYSNIIGADFDKSATVECQKLTGLKKIKALDTLGNSSEKVLAKFKLNEKVDAIFGNPPYVPMNKQVFIDTDDHSFLKKIKDSGSNLFVAALYRAFELVKEKGYISYIIPKNFLHVASYKLLRQKILKSKKIISIVDLGAYFKDVRGEQVVLTMQNDHSDDNIISINIFKNGNFTEPVCVKQSFYSDEILLFQSEHDYLLYQKLQSSYQKLDDICTGYIGRGKSTSNNAITGKNIKKFGFKGTPVPRKGNQVFIQNIYSTEAGIIATFAGDLEAAQTVTVFTDSDEKMCRYIVGILHSRLCNYYLLKFCFNNSKLTMHTDAKYLKKIPLMKENCTFNKIVNIVKILETAKYMTEEWFDTVEELNSLVYQTYKLSAYEIEHVNDEMKKIQSQRWNNDRGKQEM